MAYTIDRNALEKRRLKADRLFKKGVTYPMVAKRLGVNIKSAYDWYHRWKRDGQDGLRSKGKPGFDSQYTKEKKRKLKKIILKGAQRSGYPTDFWTLGRIRETAKKELGVDLGIKRTWITVCSLGFSAQKPERRAKERDEEAIITWKETTFPSLKKMGRQ